jgi:rubrerythrin
MATTVNNLQAAFAGESQANRRYLFFAEKAEKEGFPQVAKLWRAIADAETVHARNHMQIIGVGTTRENLIKSIDGEGFEFRTMYPEFIEQAKAEGNRRAENTFDWARQVEKIHHKLYEDALKAIGAGQQPKAKDYYVCQVCGMTVEGEAPDKCPVCQAPKAKFKKVD